MATSASTLCPVPYTVMALVRPLTTIFTQASLLGVLTMASYKCQAPLVTILQQYTPQATLQPVPVYKRMLILQRPSRANRCSWRKCISMLPQSSRSLAEDRTGSPSSCSCSNGNTYLESNRLKVRAWTIFGRPSNDLGIRLLARNPNQMESIRPIHSRDPSAKPRRQVRPRSFGDYHNLSNRSVNTPAPFAYQQLFHRLPKPQTSTIVTSS
jgi:hypothetical protein